MRIQEIDDALKLVDELPKHLQEICAFFLRSVVEGHEQETTMTERQRAKLERLRRKERERDMKARMEKWRRMLE
jgi:hypothetical protein